MADLDDPFLALIDARLRELEAAKAIEPWPAVFLGVVDGGVITPEMARLGDASAAEQAAAMSPKVKAEIARLTAAAKADGRLRDGKLAITHVLYDPLPVGEAEERRIAQLQSSGGGHHALEQSPRGFRNPNLVRHWPARGTYYARDAHTEEAGEVS